MTKTASVQPDSPIAAKSGELVLHGDDIGLDWLKAVTCLENDRAVLTDWHVHEYTELICCLKGEYTYELRQREPAMLSAGMCLVVPAGMPHRIQGTIDAPGRRIGLALLPHVNAHRRFSVFSADDIRYLYSKILAKRCQAFACPHGVLPQFRAMRDFLQREDPVQSWEWGMARIAVSAIFAGIATARVSQQDPVQPFEIREAVRYICEHACENLNLEDLVRHIGYSRARFFDLFKKHTGLTPHDYHLRQRIEHAKRELSAGGEGIGKIARRCGFADIAAFSRIFKRYTGFAPSSFRREKTPPSPESAAPSPPPAD